MLSSYGVRWIVAFAFTQAIEVPLYLRLLRCRFWVAFGASAITHPILWFLFFPCVPFAHRTKLVLGEITVCLVEAGYFRLVQRTRPATALWIAFVANAASLGAGEVSRWLFGFP